MKKWVCDLCGKDAVSGEYGYAESIEIYEEKIQFERQYYRDSVALDVCDWCHENVMKEVLKNEKHV